jgi:phosphoglycolate phosphatase-like HAD superfamily hydrolase
MSEQLAEQYDAKNGAVIFDFDGTIATASAYSLKLLKKYLSALSPSQKEK